MYTLYSLKRKLKNYLPQDEVFRVMFKPHLDKTLDFTPVELQENASLLVSLLNSHEIVKKYDGKHFHILTILCAAWVDNLELVKNLIENSIYEKHSLKQAAMNIFAYRKTLTCLADFTPLEQEHLWKVARLAGRGGNFDLIADLRKEDAYLTGYILEGAREASDPNLLQAVERMLIPFSSCTVASQITEVNSKTTTDVTEPDSKRVTMDAILLLFCVFLIGFISGVVMIIFAPITAIPTRK